MIVHNRPVVLVHKAEENKLYLHQINQIASHKRYLPMPLRSVASWEVVTKEKEAPEVFFAMITPSSLESFSKIDGRIIGSALMKSCATSWSIPYM
mmetsp:Transcript_80740/g.216468  ORF Transcript_80740/g.216468 Transcript_80740/m.216468 type:complete len:95 (-) Transcript_80740:893-1177(-)